jgi:hypothetical protein
MISQVLSSIRVLWIQFCVFLGLILATCPTYFIFLYFAIQVVFDEGKNSWSSHHAVFSSLLSLPPYQSPISPSAPYSRTPPARVVPWTSDTKLYTRTQQPVDHLQDCRGVFAVVHNTRAHCPDGLWDTRCLLHSRRQGAFYHARTTLVHLPLTVFRDVTPCSFVSNTVLSTTRRHVPRRFEASVIPLWEPKILHNFTLMMGVAQCSAMLFPNTCMSLAWWSVTTRHNPIKSVTVIQYKCSAVCENCCKAKLMNAQGQSGCVISVKH